MGLSNPNEVSETTSGIGNTWTKFLNTIEARQIQLELALAQARNVPVHIIDLKTLVPVPVYDFSQTQFLLQDGYRQTKWVLDSGLLAQLGQSDTWLLRLHPRLN